MNYTFRDLLEALKELDEEQLDMTATVCDYEAEEFYPIEFTSNSDDIIIESNHQPGTDRLGNSNHPILVIKSGAEEPQETYVYEYGRGFINIEEQRIK